MPNTKRPDAAQKLARIEARRRRLGVTLEELARFAGMHVTTLVRMRQFNRGSDRNIRQLIRALRILQRRRAEERAAFGSLPSSTEAIVELSLKGFLAAANTKLPEKYAKKVAVYLLVTGANAPAAIAGRILGCTRQNVFKMVRSVEDLREDPDLGPVIDKLELALFPNGEG